MITILPGHRSLLRAHLETSTWSKHAVDLPNRPPLVQSEIQNAVGNHDVHTRIRQGISSDVPSSVRTRCVSRPPGLRDHDGFQAWLVAERENVLQQRVSILRAIVKQLPVDPQAAVPYARLLVEIDPLDEQSRAQLSGFSVKLSRHREVQQLIETG